MMLPDSGGLQAFLSIDYKHPKYWLFIESCESLLLKANGAEMRFQCDIGSLYNRTVERHGYVHEVVRYRCTKDQLIKIAQSRTLLVKIKGQDSEPEYKF